MRSTLQIFFILDCIESDQIRLDWFNSLSTTQMSYAIPLVEKLMEGNGSTDRFGKPKVQIEYFHSIINFVIIIILCFL